MRWMGYFSLFTQPQRSIALWARYFCCYGKVNEFLALLVTSTAAPPAAVVIVVVVGLDGYLATVSLDVHRR